jgi:hypothetical protein
MTETSLSESDLANQIRRLRKHSSRTKGVEVNMGDSEIHALLSIIAGDLELNTDVDTRFTSGDYYSFSIDEIDSDAMYSTTPKERLKGFVKQQPGAFRYFKALMTLHGKRLKYKQIKEHQGFTDLDAIVQRGMLEYGEVDGEYLPDWMKWRKFAYDIDNRVAQEAGYVFEPILAEALGGEQISQSKAPIEGRQIDALVAETQTAYEFKLRVTIAASGQGRFQKMQDKAEDIRESGYRPILLVLDPSQPSDKLRKLIRRYEDQDGEVFVGNEAWEHLDERSGESMGTFIDLYVERMVTDLVEGERDGIEDITFRNEDGKIILEVAGEEFVLSESGGISPTTLDEYTEEE